MNTASGGIEEDFSYVLGNESEGKIGYNLCDGKVMITDNDTLAVMKCRVGVSDVDSPINKPLSV